MRVFGLIDCINCYASCEHVFQPQLNHKPIIVLSNNDGLVIARSNEVKPYVSMRAPFHQIKPIIAQYDIAVFSSNYEFYGDSDILSIDSYLRQRILQSVGIPVSIGFAPSKTLSRSKKTN